MANIHLSACLSVCCLSACLSVCLALWVRVSCSLGCSGTLRILRWWWTLFYLLSDGITGFCHDAWYINAPGLQKYWKNNCLARALARVSNRFSKFAMWFWGGVGVGVAFHDLRSLHKSEGSGRTNQMVPDKRRTPSPTTGQVLCHLSKIALLLEDTHSCY